MYIYKETSVLHPSISSRRLIGIFLEFRYIIVSLYISLVLFYQQGVHRAKCYRAWSPMGHGAGFASDMLCQIIVVVIGW